MKPVRLRFSRRTIFSLMVVLVFLLAIVPVLTVVMKSAHAASASPTTITFRGKTYAMAQSGTQPPTDAQCRAQTGAPCYSPQEMHRAYGLNPVLNAGNTGVGQTIVLIDSFGSPPALSDLQTFDAGYGLPDPPSFKVLARSEQSNLTPTIAIW